jgi:hypothetical protein
MVVCVPAATYDIASQDASEAFNFLGMNTNIERTGMDGTSRKCYRSEYRISTTMEDFFSNMNSKKTTHIKLCMPCRYLSPMSVIYLLEIYNYRSQN